MIKTSRSLALASAFGLTAFAVTASADNFSVSGAGGPIPDTAVVPGTWNSTYTGVPFISTVNVTRNVTSITTVRLTGLQHTWRGDLHIILRSPSAAFNIVVRPGSTGLSVGDSGDYLSGVYNFVETGGGTVAQGATSIGGGTYNQFFNSGTGQWTTGISNTPLSGITGPAGIWTLEIRDWAAADTGSLTGWTLEGTDVSGGTSFTPFCFGAPVPGLGISVCPCGNNGSIGNGCANSTNPAGANLSAAGNASLIGDTVLLTAAGQSPNKLSLFVQSATEITPVFSGDGRLCLSNLLRMYTVTSPSGSPATTTSAPNAGSDPASIPISLRSAALGDLIVPGTTRSYQVFYRNNDEVFCPTPTGDLWNLTNGLRIAWTGIIP